MVLGEGQCVEPTQVVLEMPRMHGEIIQELLDSQPDIEVVAVLDGTASLHDAVMRSHPGVVIVASDQFRIPPAWLDLLEARPTLKLLAVASTGHHSVLCEVVGDIPPRRLVEAVRSARARP